MKFRKLTLVALLLLAILTLGAVSASEDSDLLAEPDTGAEEESILEESPAASDENIVEPQEPIASNGTFVVDEEPIVFEDVNFDVRHDDYSTNGSDGKADEALCIINVPQISNGTIVVSSGDEVFFNKSLNDYNDSNFYWPTGEEAYDYAITPSDVNFFSNLKTGDIVKFSLFDGDNLVGSRFSQITFENDCFRLDDAFRAWIWDDFDSKNPVYIDTLEHVVNLNVWNWAVDGVFYVSCNGKEYKFRPMYDENGNAWRNFMLRSFGITDVGVYPVTITYGTEDDRGDVVAQRTLNVREFNHDVFRAVTLEDSYLVRLYCPDGSYGNISIFIKFNEDGDYSDVPVKMHEITSDDYGKWLSWTFDELGCELETSYDVKIEITDPEYLLFRSEDYFRYAEHREWDFVPDDVFMEINQWDIWNLDEWVVDIYIPELSPFTQGILTITSGSIDLLWDGDEKGKILKYWEMEINEGHWLYHYQVKFSDLMNLDECENNDIVAFTFSYDDNGTQKEIKRIAFLGKNDGGSVRFDSFVYVRNSDDYRGIVYLDTLENVVNLNVWNWAVDGVFYVSCNGKEYKFRPMYDENGNAWRNFMLSSFGITEPGVYPITVTYGTENDRGDVVVQRTLNVQEFNNDAFRVIKQENSHLIILYCPDDSYGNISIFVRAWGGSDYSDVPAKMHEITSDDYGKWLSWTFDELGCEMDNGYDFKIEITDSDDSELFRFEDGFWYNEHWERGFVPDDVFMEINQENMWDPDEWVVNIYIPELSSVTEGNLTIKAGTINMTPDNKPVVLKYWEMDFDDGCRLYQYQFKFSDLKNYKKRANNQIITFTFSYDDNGTQKEIKRIAFIGKNDDGSIRFDSFVYVRNSDDSGLVYLDTADGVISIDVWTDGITGTFYVSVNGTEYKYRVNYDLDENGGYHNWPLSSFGITEAGEYPVVVTYGTEDDRGDILFEGVLKVVPFEYDNYRAITYGDDQFISLYCPDGAEGTVFVFIRKDDVEEYPTNPVITHQITSEDYGQWLNWTFKDLQCKKENGYAVFIQITDDQSGEVFRYEDNFWYGEHWERDFVPNQTAVEVKFVEFWDDFDSDGNSIMTIYIPEDSFVDGGTITVKSSTKTLLSKYVNYWEMDFDNTYRLYEYNILLRDLNLKGLTEDILTYNFTYNEKGSQKSIINHVFFEKMVNEDDETGYSFDYFKVMDANVFDDDVVLFISDFPDGVDELFCITVGIWGRETVTTWNISNLTRNDDGFYVWKVSDFSFSNYDFYPDAEYDLFIDFTKDGEEYDHYEMYGSVYYNPAISNGEISLTDEENYVVIFVKKPDVDETFTIAIKKDGVSFSNLTWTLSELDQYYTDDEEWYLIGPEALGITENGEYEVTFNFFRDGVPLSYSNTFNVVDFVINVRYSDDDPWDKIAVDIMNPIFQINLPEDSDGRVVVLVNGTEVVNKALEEIGFSHWNRMGAYYICLNDLQITENGKYGVNLTVYAGNTSRSVETNVTVEVSPNSFEFCDVVYWLCSEDEDTFFKFSLGTPLPEDTIVTVYLNSIIAAQGRIRTDLDFNFGAPELDQFRDELGVFKPGDYTGKVTYTYSNGTTETITEGSFSILTKSGDVSVTVSPNNAVTLDHVYVEIAASEPASYGDCFVLYIIVDPDSDDPFHIEEYDLYEIIWNDASTKRFDLGTLSAGTHTILVEYFADDDGVVLTTDFFVDKFTVTVKKTSTVLTAPTKTVTFYKVAKKLVVTLKYSKNSKYYLLKNKKVTVKVGTISKTLTTNSKGQVSVDISSLMPKNYFAYLSFAGNSYYKASSKKVTVQVNKATPKILAPIKGYKVNVKVKTVTATLKDNKGKIIKNGKLTLKINGKSYIARTNAKGIATFKVTNLNKKATFKGIINFAGDKYFKALNGRVTVVVK